MTALAFSVPGRPVPQGSKKAMPHRTTGHPILIDDNSPALKRYRKDVGLAARAAHATCLSGPVEVDVWFLVERPKTHFGTGRNSALIKESAPEHPVARPDLDKYVRAVLDALTQVCWHDDSQVVTVTARKRYCVQGAGPETVIEVEPVGGEQ